MKVSLNPLNNGGGVKANHSVELNRGITPGLCITCFLPGGLTCQKEKEGERQRRSLTDKHSHGHMKKRSILNAIKALKNQSLIYSHFNSWSFVENIWSLNHKNPDTSIARTAVKSHQV